MKFLLLFLLLIAGVAEAGQDDDFLAARDAFRVGDAAKLAVFAKRLQNSPLEVYVAYYQLRMRLADADSGTVRAYLARPEDTPMVDRLRADWLAQLGRNQQGELFDGEFPRLL
ncbi:MAG: transglycosylase, partial [Gallionella sp.]|nr:transglycosylase [Gallionella sp.]